MRAILRKILKDSRWSDDNPLVWPVFNDGIGRTFPTHVRCDYCDNRGWVRYRTHEEEDCPVCSGGAGLLTWCVVNKRYRLKLNRPMTGRKESAA